MKHEPKTRPTVIATALALVFSVPAHAWKVEKGTEVQLKLTDTGNFGISTANPDTGPYRFAVRGATDDSSAYAAWIGGKTSNTPALVIRNDGNIGIGTASSSAKLEVAGQVKITGGSPGAGKVLTSDASGLASWQAASGGGGGGSGSSMVSGMPDAVRCKTTFGWNEVVFYLELSPYVDSTYYYKARGSDGVWLTINSSGVVANYANKPTECAGKTVSQLYAEGRAFNFVGGGGSGGSSQWTTAGSTISYAAGNVEIGANPVRFSSGWTGFPDNATTKAEISNDTTGYKTLMIVGNKSAGGVRRVSVWDRLEVNGEFAVTGQVKIAGGSPGAGKVLTSDASGLASWQAASGGGGNGTFANLALSSNNVTRGGLYLANMGDFNHAIYNNYSNIDGEGQWDGSKWNTYAGLDVRTGATGGRRTVLTVRDNGVGIGIGTQTPAGRLDVSGDRLVVRNSNESGGEIALTGADPASTPTWHIDNHGGDRFRIFRQPNISTAGFEVMTALNNGNVGIGTASPGAKLHVSSGDASIALFGPNATWNSLLAVGAGPNQIASNKAQVISTNGNLHLDSGVGQHTYINHYSGTHTFLNTGSGNVGIGTTSPGQKLTVAGVIESTSGGIKFPDGTVQTTAVMSEVKTVSLQDNVWTSVWHLTPAGVHDDSYGGMYKIQCGLNGATCTVGAAMYNSGQDQGIGNPGQVQCAVAAHATYQAALIEVQVRGAWNAHKYLYVKADHRDEYENTEHLSCKISRLVWGTGGTSY